MGEGQKGLESGLIEEKPLDQKRTNWQCHKGKGSTKKRRRERKEANVLPDRQHKKKTCRRASLEQEKGRGV